jgi:hypothetical protein
MWELDASAARSCHPGRRRGSRPPRRRGSPDERRLRVRDDHHLRRGRSVLRLCIIPGRPRTTSGTLRRLADYIGTNTGPTRCNLTRLRSVIMSNDTDQVIGAARMRLSSSAAGHGHQYRIPPARAGIRDIVLLEANGRFSHRAPPVASGHNSPIRPTSNPARS